MLSGPVFLRVQCTWASESPPQLAGRPNSLLTDWSEYQVQTSSLIGIARCNQVEIQGTFPPPMMGVTCAGNPQQETMGLFGKYFGKYLA